jgi:hypothetical protein
MVKASVREYPLKILLVDIFQVEIFPLTFSSSSFLLGGDRYGIITIRPAGGQPQAGLLVA